MFDGIGFVFCRRSGFEDRFEGVPIVLAEFREGAPGGFVAGDGVGFDPVAEGEARKIVLGIGGTVHVFDVEAWRDRGVARDDGNRSGQGERDEEESTDHRLVMIK